MIIEDGHRVVVDMQKTFILIRQVNLLTFVLIKEQSYFIAAEICEKVPELTAARNILSGCLCGSRVKASHDPVDGRVLRDRRGFYSRVVELVEHPVSCVITFNIIVI